VQQCCLCGQPGVITINTDSYCELHDEIGVERTARITAWKGGAPRDVIEEAGLWALEQYLTNPKVRRELGR
jgi:hypothetical protein